MKKIKFYFISFFVIPFVSLLLSGCDNNGDVGQTSRVTVRMTDLPGDYDAVNIDVQDVLIKASSDSNDSEGWVSIGTAIPKIYDLLNL